MARNANLVLAKKTKNDEFYTQYGDIEAEMTAYVRFNTDVFRDKTILLPCDDYQRSNFTKYFAENFTRFGLKKLISTSYARSMAEHSAHGKLFTLTRDNDNGCVESKGYLEGNGDFRSAEVTALRDEADIIITNPPFSLFREFLAWILAGNKQFIIIGNLNAITYKEVFPLLKGDKIWMGYTRFTGGATYFIAPQELYDPAKMSSDKHAYLKDGKFYWRVNGVRWFTNVDHGGRHKLLLLDTMAHNLKFNKKLRKKFENDYGKVEYPHYDNYDAIEVPFVECIPSDYEGGMGVPISFMDKWNPDQFEIVGMLGWAVVNGKRIYARILIRYRHESAIA